MAKTIVKHWWGSSNDSKKAKFKEFKTKKEADEYVRKMRRQHKINGSEISGASNFYEVYKKQS